MPLDILSLLTHSTEVNAAICLTICALLDNLIARFFTQKA
jgi:hypothetical protein